MLPDITSTALRMLTRHGLRADEWASDAAFGYDPGPARDFWLAVLARIPQLQRVRTK